MRCSFKYEHYVFLLILVAECWGMPKVGSKGLKGKSPKRENNGNKVGKRIPDTPKNGDAKLNNGNKAGKNFPDVTGDGNFEKPDVEGFSLLEGNSEGTEEFCKGFQNDYKTYCAELSSQLAKTQKLFKRYCSLFDKSCEGVDLSQNEVTDEPPDGTTEEDTPAENTEPPEEITTDSPDGTFTDVPPRKTTSSKIRKTTKMSRKTPKRPRTTQGYTKAVNSYGVPSPRKYRPNRRRTTPSGYGKYTRKPQRFRPNGNGYRPKPPMKPGNGYQPNHSKNGRGSVRQNGKACVDKSNYCAVWASFGECNVNPFWMKPNCQRSCNSCGLTVGDVNRPRAMLGCRNNHDLCQFWKETNQCLKNRWTSRNCKLSCGTCWK